ncbi:spore germination protein KC [Scopulibacillus darangshiensis]|uniref:Spore germination protein KC n=1 Tax=Scopulibacillus darangshiensis TaxID=442528 RepID=A0A4R2P3G0_9BACL|nr:Ger(x)C family spore germination protein [Scopulibacillus darangshiensis]TCP29212.1 spore germination protein KC [Scopulibacillus darangshiensis]
MINLYFRKLTNILLCICLCFFMLLLTGCWDRTEINDLALVLGTGIDKTDDNKIQLSVQLSIPKAMGGTQQGTGGGGSGKPTIVKKATGSTIYDAMSRLQEKVSRKIFWGHNRVVIFGEALAKDGIRKDIDFFARHPEPRLRAYTFVSTGKAIDILEVIPELERSSAEIARELANFKIGMSVTVKDLLQMLNSGADSAALPWLEINPTEGLRVNGTAVFKKDKMKGSINDKLTRGLLWLRDDVHLATVTIEPKNTKGSISFNLLRSKTKLVPKIVDGKWQMIAKITTEDDAVENDTALNLMDPKIVKDLEKQLAQRINQRIRMTLNLVQKDMRIDVFGFGEAFHRKYPNEWEKVKGHWSEKFPEIEVKIDSKAHIRRPGMSTEPQGIPKNEVKK